MRESTTPETEDAAGQPDGSALTGGVAVTAGLLIFGVSSFAFLFVAGRNTTEAQFNAVAALWSLVYALAGVFSPLEQEATRAVAERRARGESFSPVVVRVATIGAVAAGIVAIALWALREPLAARVLGGHDELVAVLAITLLGTGASFVVRGVLAGVGRYRAYGAVLAGEGVLRVVGAGVVAALLLGSAGSFGVVLAAAAMIPPLLGLAVLPRRAARRRPGSWTEVTANLGWLVCGSVVSQAVANAGPVVLQLLGPTDRGLPGRFLAAFVLVRIPLFFTTALQASLLPRLVLAVERHDAAGYARALRQMVAIVGGLGVLALAGFAVAGPLFVSLLTGRSESLARVDLVLLGLSSVLFLLGALLQSAVLAVGGHRVVAAVWGIGGLLFAVGCLLPIDPLPRLELAYLVASAVVPALFTIWLGRSRRRSAVSGQR